jgi:hypothetical protein
MLRAVGTPNVGAFAFQDKSSTPGNVTIDRRAGRFAFAIGSNSVVVTCAVCKTDSVVLVQMLTFDTGPLANRLRAVIATPANGSFTVQGDNNAHAIIKCAFLVLQGLP